MSDDDAALVKELTLRAGRALVRGGPNPVWELICRLREQNERIQDLEQKVATARIMLSAAGVRRKAG